MAELFILINSKEVYLKFNAKEAIYMKQEDIAKLIIGVIEFLSVSQ